MNDRELLEEKAIQYALGTLPREETVEFENQLMNDRELQGLVHDYQVINEVDAEEVQPVEPPFALYSRIMAEIDSEEKPVAGSAKASGASIVPIWSWAGWAVAACAAIVLGLNTWTQQSVEMLDNHNDIMLSDLGKPGEAQFVVNQGEENEEALELRMIELADLAEAYWFSREGISGGDDAVVVDSPTGGFTIFDSKHKIGFIGVENLPSDERGTAYHVWAKVQSGDSPMRAGRLRGGENSRGLFFFDLSQSGEIEDLAGGVSFFVTEETEEIPVAPSGQIVLSGI